MAQPVPKPKSAPQQPQPQLQQPQPQLPPRIWHRPDHLYCKTIIAQQIEDELKAKQKASPDFYAKIPQMAQRLNEALYFKAKDFVEYCDTRTVKARLHEIAEDLKKATEQKQQPPPVNESPYYKPAPMLAQPPPQPQPQPQPQQQMVYVGALVRGVTDGKLYVVMPNGVHVPYANFH
jgi:hypothetical protein